MKDSGNIVMSQQQMIAEQKAFERRHGAGEKRIVPGQRGSEVRFTYPDGAQWILYMKGENGQLKVDGFFDSDRNYIIKVI